MVKKVIFIAGTGKDIGKTSISLLLIHLFGKQYERIGYIKPISQRFVHVAGLKAGDDPVLIKQVFKLNHDLCDMSPVVIESDLTTKVINGEIGKPFSKKILRAFKNIEKESDIVIVEGAGRGGVGSVINQSNADTAKLLNADVLLVGGGGVGRAIDNVMLDKIFFEAKGCRVIGVIINKVFSLKYEKICPLLKDWFRQKRIPLFGVLPYHVSLCWPGLLLIKQKTDAEVLNPVQYADKKIERVLIAAKGVDHVLQDFQRCEQGVLLIVPSDRIDLFFFLTSPYFKNMTIANNVSGVLVSGAGDDKLKVQKIFESFWAPVLISSHSIYDLATIIHDLKPKMLLEDEKNIETIKNLSEEFVDFDLLQESLNSKKGLPKKTFKCSVVEFLSELFRHLCVWIKRLMKIMFV